MRPFVEHWAVGHAWEWCEHPVLLALLVGILPLLWKRIQALPDNGSSFTQELLSVFPPQHELEGAVEAFSQNQSPRFLRNFVAEGAVEGATPPIPCAFHFVQKYALLRSHYPPRFFAFS